MKTVKTKSTKVLKNSKDLTDEETKLISDERSSSAYDQFSTKYDHFVFWDFESFLRLKLVDEDDI